MIKLPAEHQAALGLDFDLKILNRLEPQIDRQPLLHSKNYSEPGGLRDWTPHLRYPINDFTAEQLTLIQMAQVIAFGYHTDLVTIVNQLVQQTLLHESNPTEFTWRPSQPFDQTAIIEWETNNPWSNDSRTYFNQVLHDCLSSGSSRMDSLQLMNLWERFNWTPAPIILSLCWQLITVGSITLQIPSQQIKQVVTYQNDLKELMDLHRQLQQYPYQDDIAATEIKSTDPDWKIKLFGLNDEQN